MKTAIIIGSPRVGMGNSSVVAGYVGSYIRRSSKVTKIVAHRSGKMQDKDKEKLQDCDNIVFFFPIYVAAIPGHFLAFLVELEQYYKELGKKDVMVYAFANCGFYNGEQAKYGINIVRLWTKRTGLTWGQGVATGSGEVITAAGGVRFGYGPFVNLGKLVDEFSKNIIARACGEEEYIQANMRKHSWKIEAYKKWIKEFGVKLSQYKKVFFRSKLK